MNFWSTNDEPIQQKWNKNGFILGKKIHHKYIIYLFF